VSSPGSAHSSLCEVKFSGVPENPPEDVRTDLHPARLLEAFPRHGDLERVVGRVHRGSELLADALGRDGTAEAAAIWGRNVRILGKEGHQLPARLIPGHGHEERTRGHP